MSQYRHDDRRGFFSDTHVKVKQKYGAALLMFCIRLLIEEIKKSCQIHVFKQ